MIYLGFRQDSDVNNFIKRNLNIYDQENFSGDL